MNRDQALVDSLASTLVALGDSVPEDIPSFRLDVNRSPYEDPRLYDYENYPPDLYVPPGTKITNRSALGSWGAYVVRDFDPAQPRGGTLIVQGTSAMHGIISLLPELDERRLNVKIIYATSPQLFAIQTKAYRQSVLSRRDWIDSTVITTQARRLMHDWLYSKVSEEYAISADWDDRWRTGGRLNEVIDEAHLSPEWLLKGIERFVRDRESRPRRHSTGRRRQS